LSNLGKASGTGQTLLLAKFLPGIQFLCLDLRIDLFGITHQR
jgi:hypothetical protein